MSEVLRPAKIVGYILFIFYCLTDSVSYASTSYGLLLTESSTDSTETDTSEVELPYDFEDNHNPYGSKVDNGLFLKDPSNVKSDLEFDPESGKYMFKKTMGENMNYRPPTYMDFDEYLKYTKSKSVSDYWQEKKETESEFQEKKGLRPELKVESKAFDRIFGGNTVDIKPSGSAELRFGVRISKTENPAIPQTQQRITTFDFKQNMQVNVIGNIGDKLKITTNYNTEATFQFDNNIKIDYTGYDDDILQDIELGNVSFPLKSSLITGSQSLFGIKTKLRFGKLDVVTVLSQQQGKKKEIEVKGGAQVVEFKVSADEYEFNRHFFLGHFFRDLYEQGVSEPPIINSPVSITKIEVWVTNTRNETQNVRNILAFQDLGEGNFNRRPDGRKRIYSKDNSIVSDLWGNVNTAGRTADGSYQANTLYDYLTNSVPTIRNFLAASNDLQNRGMNARLDFTKVELARKLSPNEFKVHDQLGYISLNQQLQPNQVLAVAYQYTYLGEVYQVGEFSTDGLEGTQPLIVKMLKSTELNTKIPMWDLMMKNIYSLGSYNVSQQNFDLQVWYLDEETGLDINFIPAGKLNDRALIQVLGMDRLNINGQPAKKGDGVFDYINNPIITIMPQKGKIIFPLLEPFGSGLREAFEDDELAENYTFDSLYTRTQADAKVRFPEKNRFSIKGEYESSNSSEIRLNSLNIPEGSVVVTAGGRTLTENSDYTVDYNLGRVKIINQGILESGTPIKVSLESNDLFGQQQKSMIASRFDYKIADNLLVGGTVMRLSERPITQKVNIGNEPIKNTIWGVDGTYNTESQFITSLIDKLPFIDTKQKSTINVSGEFAQLLPGHSRAIGKEGNSYIDDFEGSQSTINLRTRTLWNIASTPQNQTELFPNGNNKNALSYGFQRARLAWYVIDPLFFRNNSLTPSHIKDNPDMQSNHYMREVFQNEVFPDKDVPVGQPANIPVFNLSFYPDERGPYNYDVDALTTDGKLKDPKENWGGIMRRIDQNDFEAANVEFIQFWMLDPFHPDNGIDEGDYPDEVTYNHEGGDLYFNLGNISEDILNDGIKSFENGLPSTEAAVSDTSTINSIWGRVSTQQQIQNAFDADPAKRAFQDVGLDGLRDQEERLHYQQFLSKVEAITSPQVYSKIQKDPSADNYNFYRDDDYDNQEVSILDRYKLYNGLEGNSPTDQQSQAINDAGYPTTASTRPNTEDIILDNTLDDFESYYQYKISIRPEDLSPTNVGRNFITNVLETNVTTKNGENRTIRWYQVKIPIKTPNKQKVGSITDFRSIRYMRMFVKGFSQPIFLRFAKLELVRGQWRRFSEDLDSRDEGFADDDFANFTVAAVNVEENSRRTPVNYVLPPFIQREKNLSTTNFQRLNEQSMAMNFCDLSDGKAVAAYRKMEVDVINYDSLKMFVHIESAIDATELKDEDLNVFVRLGADFEDNYYEYEIPISVTDYGQYNEESVRSRKQVWPTANNVAISLRALAGLKTQRNSESFSNPNIIRQRFKGEQGKADIYIKGNPNLATIKTIMIGIRNPYREPGDMTDDGLPKCGEVWVNEFRLTDFDDNGGWAAIGRVSTRLADLATVNLSGHISTPGFGSIDKKVSKRQRETIKGYDANASFELGKFLPEKVKIKIPTYIGISKEVIEPQFSPIEQDVKYVDVLKELDPDEAKNFSNTVLQTTTRKSLNFTNIRKEKTKKGKAMPYDISNFSFNYAFTEELKTSFKTEKDMHRTFRGGMNYTYSPSPKNVKPFQGISYLKRSKYYSLLSDFNFYYLPNSIGFRSTMNRQYSELLTRNSNPGILATLPTYYNKNFTWDRNYTFRYDLTRSLKFDFNATAKALIEEPAGLGYFQRRALDAEVSPTTTDSVDAWKNQVFSSLKNLGTKLNYQHASNLSYNIPINKIPVLDFISSDIKYSSTYSWKRSPRLDEDITRRNAIGNTIQNSHTMRYNGRLNMTSLYNKVPYVKTVNQKARRVKRSRGKLQKAARNTKKAEEGEKVKKESLNPIEQGVLLLQTLKSVNGSFSETYGTMLPGFNQNAYLMGMSRAGAPGVGFIFGQQQYFGSDSLKFHEYAQTNDWLVKNPNLNSYITNTYKRDIMLNASLEPINDFRINLSATQNRAVQNQEFFRWVDSVYTPTGDFVGILNEFQSQSQVQNGNFSSSIWAFNTTFRRSDAEKSVPFEKFKEFRQDISQRLGEEHILDGDLPHVSDSGYANGYGIVQQDVLIPAFLAAYTGATTKGVALSPFLEQLPKLNWRVSYNGLSKIPAVKEYLDNITLNHSYRATYQVGSYTTNLLFEGDEKGKPVATNLRGDYIPELQINTVSINESFSPLIGFNMKWKNSITTKIEFSRTRNVALNMANTQINEMKSREYVIGAGYTIKDLVLPWEITPGKKLQSDLKIRIDFSMRDDVTFIRKLIEDETQTTAGQNVFSTKFSADYKISQNMTVRAYFDRVANKPKITRSFPTANTQAGISLRFNLS